jgi:hypothetical protein
MRRGFLRRNIPSAQNRVAALIETIICIPQFQGGWGVGASYGLGFTHTRDLSIDACWLRFTGESILADWLASEFCFLSTLYRLIGCCGLTNRSLSAVCSLWLI